KRENSAGKDRAGAVNETSQCRKMNFWPQHDDTSRESDDRTDFDEGAQVIARSQKQPDREHGGSETIKNNHDGDLWSAEGEPGREQRMFINPTATNQSQHEEYETNDGCLQHFSWPYQSHVPAHQKGDRNGCTDGECSPRTAFEGVGDHQSQDGDENDDNHQDAQQCDKATHRTDFFSSHLSQGLRLATQGPAEHAEILHRTTEYDARQDP